MRHQDLSVIDLANVYHKNRRFAYFAPQFTLLSEIKASAWLTPFKSTSNLINANSEKIWFWCVSINTNFESQNIWSIQKIQTLLLEIIKDHKICYDHRILSFPCVTEFMQLFWKTSAPKKIKTVTLTVTYDSVFLLCASHSSLVYLLVKADFKYLIVFYLEQI